MKRRVRVPREITEDDVAAIVRRIKRDRAGDYESVTGIPVNPLAIPYTPEQEQSFRDEAYLVLHYKKHSINPLV